jgi:hypothetical protein
VNLVKSFLGIPAYNLNTNQLYLLWQKVYKGDNMTMGSAIIPVCAAILSHIDKMSDEQISRVLWSISKLEAGQHEIRFSVRPGQITSTYAESAKMGVEKFKQYYENFSEADYFRFAFQTRTLDDAATEFPEFRSSLAMTREFKPIDLPDQEVGGEEPQPVIDSLSI